MKFKILNFSALLITLFQFLRCDKVNGQVCFPPYSDISNSSNWAIITADFNHDGKPDVATANYTNNNATVRLGNGAGGLGSIANYQSYQNPTALTSGDFNSDGNPDLAVANVYSSDLSIRMGNGSGGLGTQTVIPISTSPTGIVCADFNSDGKKDLVTVNNSSSDLSLLVGNGAGSFATPSNFATGYGPDAIAAADFNNDGKQDVVTISGVMNSVSIVLGNGAGSFATPTTFTVGSGPHGIMADDLNADGNVDIVTANSGSNTISVLLGNGSGGFAPLISLSAGTNPYDVVSGDFNSDGLKDIACANYSSYNVSVFLNAGSGTFGQATNFMVSGAASSLCVADFNSDGKQDLAVACYGSYSIALLFQAVAPHVTASASSMAVCLGSQLTLSGSGAATYSWTNGVTNGTAFAPTTTQTYKVVGADTNSCRDSAYVTVQVAIPATPDICMVTVDFPSNYNIIYWDKTPFNNADSFIIHREVQTNTYLPVGAVAYADSSFFIDTVRSIGPANGNPNITSYRYKLQIKDTCGNLGGLSPYHTSIYFNDLLNGSFTWNTYNIEGMSSTPVTFFELIRDDNNTGVFNLVGAAAGTATTLNDPQYSIYKNTAVWRVNANGMTCTPTFKTGEGNEIQNTVSKSRSNIKNNLVSQPGIKEIAATDFSVYPNPAKDQITIDFKTPMKNCVIEIVDVLGRVVGTERQTTNDKQQTTNVSGLSGGIYSVRIISDNGKAVKKLVVEK